MEDWESEDFEPAPPAIKKEQPKSLWDDEDVEEDVKESWEDEDVSEAPKTELPVEKTVSKPGSKAAGMKGKTADEKTSEAKKTAVADEVLSDPLAEKLRQQRLVEEADFKSTTELFAQKGDENKGDENSLDNFIPMSENDFLEYAELISRKLRPYEKSFHYMGLLKAVTRLSMSSMKAADAKEVASSVTTIANEKLKAEKEAMAGKKKMGAKKKQLLVDKPDDDVVANPYDALDDYDFM